MKTGAAKWFLAGSLCLAALTWPARATTWTVTNTSDNEAGSLRQAIASAVADDEIVFQIPQSDPGYNGTTRTFTINLTSGGLAISKSLQIRGGSSRVVVRRGAAISFRIIDVTAGNVVLENLTIQNGQSPPNDLRGGNIRNAGNLTIRGCTIRDGSTAGSGGGIYNAGVLFLVNSTVAWNSGFGSGGIFNAAGGDLTMRSCTVANNLRSGGSIPAYGVWNANGATARVGNCIIVDNDLNAMTRADVAGAFISEGYNLIGEASAATGFNATGDQTNAGANLGPLTDNGGATPTMMPGPGSLAIDKGILVRDSNGALLTVDQRENPRPYDDPAINNAEGGDGSDIGAVEFDPAQVAPNFVVTTTDEHDDGVCGVADCSLLEALNVSNANSANNSVITFAPTAYGTITNTLTAGGLSITRPVTVNGPGADLVAISGAGVNRIFNVTSAGAVALNHLTVRDARSTSGDGGALRYNGSGTLTIHACRFNNNTTAANWSGGAIWTVGRLTITNSEFNRNKGGGGGAVYPRFGSIVTISACNFHDNEAINTAGGGLGGAMLLWDGPNVTISDSSFTNNKAPTSGGAIHVLANSTLNISNSTLSGNSVALGGTGGALANAGNMHLTGVTLSGNSANFGYGGGIHSSGTSTLTNVTLSGNTADGNSVSPGYGGGIYNLGTATLTNVTLSGNSGYNVGGISHAGGSVTLKNTAIARGASGENCGGFTGGTSNLSDDGMCGFSTGSENRDGINLLLGSLANYGGLTQTHLPSVNPKSPLIDSGTDNGAPTTDQRGINRPQGAGFDVGAVEVASSDIPPPTPTPTATPSSLGNISTRLRVLDGDNALFGGMIAIGTGEKKVIIRAIGPTLTDFGLPGALQDPTLELFQGNVLIGSNDDWRNSAQQAEIANSGFAPNKDAESAIIVTLTPNQNYSAIVRGKNGETGIGLVEVFDLDQAAASKLGNISTRGFVDVDDNVMIAGLIVSPSNGASVNVLVRALGPTLGDFGVQGFLADPTLDLVNASGTLLRSNDSWQSDQGSQIQAANLAPKYDQEAALIHTLAPGQYTAIVRGSGRTTGVGLVEVYNIP